MPYDCIKDTSKIAHSIIHEHKYTLEGTLTHTHSEQSTLPITCVSTCTHMSSIFQQEKVQLIKFKPTDKIPTHEHLYSDQHYHINSIANPHIEN